MTAVRPEPWPAGFEPDRAPVSSVNELVVPADVDHVWRRLIDARAWPQWYGNARRVVLTGGEGVLGPGTRFRWTTFGVRVGCRVEVFRPGVELSWSGRAFGSTGYHRWMLHPLPNGRTRVITDEVQRGLIPSLAKGPLSRGLLLWHQRWLEGIAG